MVIGSVLAERYRIDQQLASAHGGNAGSPQGRLWRGADRLAEDAPVALRQLLAQESQQRFRDLWPALQAILHPLIPRFGGLLEEEDSLWLVREWQHGTAFDAIQQQRNERQLVFGAGEVLLLLRQLLPALAVLHASNLVHGDLNPGNLLRRDRDGLPVLLGFGSLQRVGAAPLMGATAGYAPRAQWRGDPAAAWMDLHGLGVTALSLLSGRSPQQLLDSTGSAWVVPETVALDAAFRAALLRLLSETPGERFEDAKQALEALRAVVMPDTAVPVQAPVSAEPDLPRFDRGASADLLTSAAGRRRPRAQDRQQAAEGSLWPVVVALLLSAVVGTALGWFLLGRSSAPPAATSNERDRLDRRVQSSLPSEEVDQRQQLLSRLRALQINRSWFLSLVDSSLLARYPERNGRLPGDGLDDLPLRRVWNELSEEWLARVEQLPPALRARLGRLKEADWRKQRDRLTQQGIDARVVEQLVTASAQNLLPGLTTGTKPPEPHRQLWFAAALRSLDDVRIEAIAARPREATVLSSRVRAGGARLISIRVPRGRRLVLGINGTPLMQMTVYGAQGNVVAERGPLRVVTLPDDAGTPVQVLVTNEGVSSGVLTLSCRADRSVPSSLPDVDVTPIPDSATGATGLVPPPQP